MQTVKAIFYDCCEGVIIDDIIQYYRDTDELIYLKLRKGRLRGSFDEFKKIMKNGGDANILKILYDKCSVSNEVQIAVNLHEKDHLILLDKDVDDVDAVYKYNKNLDMYVNIASKVFVKPDNSCAYEALFLSFIKI